jgi:hypothetical protein
MTITDSKIRIVKISPNVPTITNFFKLKDYFENSLQEKLDLTNDNFEGCVIHYVKDDIKIYKKDTKPEDIDRIVTILVIYTSKTTGEKYSANGSFITIDNKTTFHGTTFPYLEKITLSEFNFLLYMMNEDFDD